jgi:hypothetical protein
MVGWTVINELERVWKEEFVAECKSQSQNVPGGTEENHKKYQSG